VSEQAEKILHKWRSQCPEGYDERVEILVVRPGYAHCLYEGRCRNITLEELCKLFVHPMFGGRSAWIRDGLFSIIRHTD